MSCRRTDVMTSVTRALEDAGATYEVDLRKGGHLRIRIAVNGKRGQYFLPSSPGDQRSRGNCVAGVRRMLRTMMENVA